MLSFSGGEEATDEKKCVSKSCTVHTYTYMYVSEIVIAPVIFTAADVHYESQSHKLGLLFIIIPD